MLGSLRILPDFFRGFIAILRTPALRRIAIYPTLIGFISFLAFLAAGLYMLDDFAGLLLKLVHSDSTLLLYLVSALLLPVGLLIAALLAFVVTLCLGGVFIDAFIRASFTRLQVQLSSREDESSIVRSVLQGGIDGIRLLVYLILLTALTSIFSFIPPLLILSPFLAAFGLGFDILDTTLATTGLSFDERIRIIKSHLLEVVVLGGVTMAVLTIPLAGVLLLPLPYYVAAAQIAHWSDPRLLFTENSTESA